MGRFGSRLGVVEWGFALAKLHFVKIHVFEKIRCQEPTWANLGPVLGGPKGSKMGAAEGQKRSYVEMILSSEVEVKVR